MPDPEDISTPPPILCAILRCTNVASSMCTGCDMVKYCSRQCQIADRKSHKRLCDGAASKGTSAWVPEWIREGRMPIHMDTTMSYEQSLSYAQWGVKEYLSGNQPAIDHLSFAGITDRADLDVLYAASGDIRNAITALLGLSGSNGNGSNAVKLYLNDVQPLVAVRSVLLILLLGKGDASVLALETAIHTWYSPFFTKEMAALLKETWSTSLEKMREAAFRPQADEEAPIATKTGLAGGGTLRLILPRKTWKLGFEITDNILSGLISTSDAINAFRHVTLHPSRVDFRDRALFWMERRYIPAMHRYFTDGIVLPFAASREGFSIPNLTLFDMKTGQAMIHEPLNPLNGWEIKKIINTNARLEPGARAAGSDIYGILHQHLHVTLARFSKQIQQLGKKLTVFVLNEDAYNLQDVLPTVSDAPRQFDLIDISNMAENGMSDVLSKIAGPLLKDNGALTSMFMNCVARVTEQTAADEVQREIEARSARASAFYDKQFYFKYLLTSGTGEPAAASTVNYTLIALRSMELVMKFRDFKALWRDYRRILQFEDLCKLHSMKIKTVKRLFAADLTPGRSGEEYITESRRMQLNGVGGNEFYVVWVRD